MAEMKGHIKTPGKELNKREISNISDAVFKRLLIKTLKEISGDLKSTKQI